MMSRAEQGQPPSSDPPADVSWGYASHEMYHSRWDKIRDHVSKSTFVLVDWGSDAGWFSVVVAHSNPEASVISVEGGLMTDGEGLALHRKKIEEYGVTNNRIVNTFFGPPTFRDLREFPSDYQLVLSVFHHMGDGFGAPLRSVEDWDNAFCDLISSSGVTFLELPNESGRAETPHGIRDWYAGREVDQVIMAAIQRRGVAAQLEWLGDTSHGDKGTRQLYMITLENPPPAAAAADIADHIASVGLSIQPSLYRRGRRSVARLLDATVRRRR